MADAGRLIIKAAKKGDVSGLRQLLDQDASLVHARDADQSTPLHCATWKGHEDVAALLIKAGADVNAENQNEHWGTTPLHAAAHANQASIAKLLLSHGANPKALDMQGRTPLFHTSFHKAKAVAKILEDYE